MNSQYCLNLANIIEIHINNLANLNTVGLSFASKPNLQGSSYHENKGRSHYYVAWRGRHSHA